MPDIASLRQRVLDLKDIFGGLPNEYVGLVLCNPSGSPVNFSVLPKDSALVAARSREWQSKALRLMRACRAGGELLTAIPAEWLSPGRREAIREISPVDFELKWGVFIATLQPVEYLEERRCIEITNLVDGCLGGCEKLLLAVNSHYSEREPAGSAEACVSGAGPSETNADSEVDSPQGVSLADVVRVINEGDADGIAGLVKKWVGSKSVAATPIGKCPIDGRVQLYKLSEILSDAEKFFSLNPAQKDRLQRHLVPVQRNAKASADKK